MRSSLQLFLLGLALLCLPLAGCGAKRQARQDARHLSADTDSLQESAELFWRSLRWGDLGVCATFIEDRSERLSWMARQAEGEGWRYRSVEIIGSEAGPSLLDEDDQLIDPSDPAQREGEVLVQVQRYGSDLVIDQRLLTQDWYKLDGGWFVESGQEAGVQAQ